MTASTPSTTSSTAAKTFTILYFASASSFTNLSSESLPAPLALNKLFPALESRYPGMTAKVLNSCAVTVNLEYVDIDEDGGGKQTVSETLEAPWDGFMIQAGDEVGIIPPVSSG